MQRGPVWERFVACFLNGTGIEEGVLKGDIIPELGERPSSDIQLSSPIKVIGDGTRYAGYARSVDEPVEPDISGEEFL